VGGDLAAAEHGGEVRGALGELEAVAVGHGEVEAPAVEEQGRAEGLVLRGGGRVTLHREMIGESGALGGAELAQVAAGVEGDEGAHPVEVRLLRAENVTEAAEGARTASTRVMETHRRGPGESCGEPQEKW
jgi:hypothetical protein